MVLEDALLLLMAGVLSTLAILTSFFIAVEVITAIRDMVGELSGTPHRTVAVQQRLSPGDTGPLPELPEERQITPYQDREAIQRIIHHLKDSDAGGDTAARST